MKRPSILVGLALVATGLIPLAFSPPGGASVHRSQCIVSLSPTATETLYKIGAGKDVEAVDTDSDFPTTGLPTKRINPFNPSAEAIATICKVTASHPSKKPDLVVISYDANHVKEKLRQLGVFVLYQTAAPNLAAAYHQMTHLGQLTGHYKYSEQIVAKLKSEIAADVASIGSHPAKVLTTYYELDTGFYSLTSQTFVGQLLKSLGVTNIADKASTAADSGGYPQLSAEYVLGKDPKLVFLADTICCHVTAASFAKRPGFSHLLAVKDHHVVGLNDDVASRWGPRIGELMGYLTSAVRAALADHRLWAK